jgi:hypothetical protein
MTDKSQTRETVSRKSIDVFIEVANASLDVIYALFAAARKAKLQRTKDLNASELRLTTLLHGPRPRLRDGDSVP